MRLAAVLVQASCAMALNIVVEGWLNISHSYSVIAQFLVLELLTRDGVDLRFRQLPYFHDAWASMRTRVMLPDAEDARLRGVLTAPEEVAGWADVVLRVGMDFGSSSSGAPTIIFATAEIGTQLQAGIAGHTLPADADVTVVTPSVWSMYGLVRLGVPAARVHVIPHGFEPGIFRPASGAEKRSLQGVLGWQGRFVFLHVGAMTRNKGVGALLQAFVTFTDSLPKGTSALSPLLVLKGNEALFGSSSFLNSPDMLVARRSSADSAGSVGSAGGGVDTVLVSPGDLVEEGLLQYHGATLSFREMAALYQVSVGDAQLLFF
jgi:hypothetical protein